MNTLIFIYALTSGILVMYIMKSSRQKKYLTDANRFNLSKRYEAEERAERLKNDLDMVVAFAGIQPKDSEDLVFLKKENDDLKSNLKKYDEQTALLDKVERLLVDGAQGHSTLKALQDIQEYKKRNKSK